MILLLGDQEMPIVIFMAIQKIIQILPPSKWKTLLYPSTYNIMNFIRILINGIRTSKFTLLEWFGLLAILFVIFYDIVSTSGL